MGLDISLYTNAEREASKAHEAAWDDVYDSGRWAAMTKAQQDEWRAANPYPDRDRDHPSERYPDHLFNRRYLRSSYNGGGFNHAVPEMLGTSGANAEYPNERGSLYWIFEPIGREWDGDEGILTRDDIPKLLESKARAELIAEELRKADRLRVFTASPNMFSAPPETSDNDALRMYREHVAEREPEGWYSSRDMDVFGGGITILAAIPGKATFNIPGVHLIYRAADEGFESYVQSAEIVAEFCEEAIALISVDGSCEMSWSG